MKERTKKYTVSNLAHRACPRCEKCVHRTVQYGAYIHRWVVGCDAKKCDYVRKDQ